MSCWGISPNASEKEKIKGEFADFINGLNSTGEISYTIYSDLFDVTMALFDEMYELNCGEPLTQPEPHEDDYDGLKVKYRVYKARNNEPVEGCFVLRPDKDNAARPALEMYAECCDNEILRRDIRLWLTDLMTRKPPSQPAKTARIIDDTPHPFSAGSERYVCSACGVRVRRGDLRCWGCEAVFEEGTI